MARNYKAERARQCANYSRIQIWLEKGAAENLKAKLEKENKKPTEFIRKAVDEYLKN